MKPEKPCSSRMHLRPTTFPFVVNRWLPDVPAAPGAEAGPGGFHRFILCPNHGNGEIGAHNVWGEMCASFKGKVGCEQLSKSVRSEGGFSAARNPLSTAMRGCYCTCSENFATA